jgi:hypothetical protein
VTKAKEQITISVLIGSTRKGRFSEKPAHWILQELRKRDGRSAASRPPRLPNALLRPAASASYAGPAALRTRRDEKVDGSNRGVGWFCIRHAGIQLRPLRSVEKRNRLGLPGVEPQGCRLCELRQRHGRLRRAAASRDGHRASNGADQIICSHSRGDALGAFPGRRRRKGPRGVGEASKRHDRRSPLLDGSPEDGARALTDGR